MIEHIRSKGHPLDSIVRKFNIAMNSEDPQSETAGNNYTHDSTHTVNPSPSLSLDEITVPAILTDTDLNIVWQNQKAIAEIWRDSAIVPREGSSIPSVFDLLFSGSFQDVVTNWHQWVTFFLQLGIARVSFDHLKTVIDNLPQNHRTALNPLIASISRTGGSGLLSRRMRLVTTSGLTAHYWVATIETHEGRLTIFDPDEGDDASARHSTDRDIHPQLTSIECNSEPMERSLHVIALRLDNAETLQTETLANEYGRIVTQVWHKCIESIERCGGVAGHPNGDLLLGYFIPATPAEDNPINLIQCALELKSQMASVEREWKLRKGWLQRIEINIGLHCSKEYVGAVTTSMGNNLTTFGDGLQTAAAMAAMVSDGRILVSKAMISRLPADALHRLRFGVYRSESGRRFFIPNSFSRIRDLDDIGAFPATVSRDISALPVTQLFEEQGS